METPRRRGSSAHQALRGCPPTWEGSACSLRGPRCGLVGGCPPVVRVTHAVHFTSEAGSVTIKCSSTRGVLCRSFFTSEEVYRGFEAAISVRGTLQPVVLLTVLHFCLTHFLVDAFLVRHGPRVESCTSTAEVLLRTLEMRCVSTSVLQYQVRTGEAVGLPLPFSSSLYCNGILTITLLYLVVTLLVRCLSTLKLSFHFPCGRALQFPVTVTSTRDCHRTFTGALVARSGEVRIWFRVQ